MWGCTFPRRLLCHQHLCRRAVPCTTAALGPAAPTMSHTQGRRLGVSGTAPPPPLTPATAEELYKVHSCHDVAPSSKAISPAGLQTTSPRVTVFLCCLLWTPIPPNYSLLNYFRTTLTAFEGPPSPSSSVKERPLPPGEPHTHLTSLKKEVSRVATCTQSDCHQKGRGSVGDQVILESSPLFWLKSAFFLSRAETHPCTNFVTFIPVGGRVRLPPSQLCRGFLYLVHF